MHPMPGLRGFSLAWRRSGHNVSCGEDGVFVGNVALLNRSSTFGKELWTVRPINELNDDLTNLYRLPVDATGKLGAMSLVAVALNRGDPATAAIATVQMQFPDPPRLEKGTEARQEIARRADELFRSGLLKFWDPTKHPRAGTPPNPGRSASTDGGSQSAEVAPVAMRNGPPWRKPFILEGGEGGGGPRGQLELPWPRIRWPWRSSPSGSSNPAPKPSAPADAEPTLPFTEGLPEQRAPAADSEFPAKDNPTQAPARGGRLGNAATRAQNAEIAVGLEKQGYRITGGGGGPEEEFIEGEGPGTKGGTYVDITAVNPTTGRTVRVQTVDTLADGITPTPREQAAIARIRENYPNDELWIIPKRKTP